MSAVIAALLLVGPPLLSEASSKEVGGCRHLTRIDDDLMRRLEATKTYLKRNNLLPNLSEAISIDMSPSSVARLDRDRRLHTAFIRNGLTARTFFDGVRSVLIIDQGSCAGDRIPAAGGPTDPAITKDRLHDFLYGP